jgi:hypothetical protein
MGQIPKRQEIGRAGALHWKTRMAIERPKKPFSKRYGYMSQPKEITVWEDAPENLRHFVLDTAVNTTWVGIYNGGS